MSFRLGPNILQSSVNTHCKFRTPPTSGMGMAIARLDCIQNHKLYIEGICTVKSPPPMHASIGQKWGGGSSMGSLHFRVTTITDHMSAWSLLSLAVWWAKLKKNNKVRHNNIMTQIAKLLAVATVSIGLWTLNIYMYILQSGRAYTWDKNYPCKNLS